MNVLGFVKVGLFIFLVFIFHLFVSKI